MNTFIEVPATKKSLAARRLVHGVGVNDANYNVYKYESRVMTGVCHYYQTWKDMLTRCYSEKSLREYPTYIGCSVVKEWLTFSNFKAWMITQDWRDKELDKDILIYGNKQYGPNSCFFVDPAINKLLNDSASIRGSYPLGVSKARYGKNKFKAKCNVNGVRTLIGSFPTINEAEQAYLSFKSVIVRDAADNQVLVIKNALLEISKKMDERSKELISAS